MIEMKLRFTSNKPNEKMDISIEKKVRNDEELFENLNRWRQFFKLKEKNDEVSILIENKKYDKKNNTVKNENIKKKNSKSLIEYDYIYDDLDDDDDDFFGDEAEDDDDEMDYYDYPDEDDDEVIND